MSKLTFSQTIIQSNEVLDKLDNIKNATTTDAAMSMLGLAVMRPLRDIAENSEDTRFLLNLEAALDETTEWGKQKAEQFARKGEFELAINKTKRDEYLDYWLTPARTYKEWIDSL